MNDKYHVKRRTKRSKAFVFCIESKSAVRAYSFSCVKRLQRDANIADVIWIRGGNAKANCTGSAIAQEQVCTTCDGLLAHAGLRFVMSM